NRSPYFRMDKPRYLMGVGTYREMAKAIAAGIDLFDCVIPTRVGRHGAALVRGQRWNLKNAQFKEDFTPLDPQCSCYCCTHFTRAYLNHLLKAKEMLGIMLISLHNIHELVDFTQRIRQAILSDRFVEEFGDYLMDDPQG
ncbi:MAG: tRNA-guanine transglycosylase, partial [Synechococcaceae cyanobacterium RL_1_2]|nr:tRNA-guanine transglycosylase [Synechococcaceae cyanobacterium RL_1_2]